MIQEYPGFAVFSSKNSFYRALKVERIFSLAKIDGISNDRVIISYITEKTELSLRKITKIK